MIHLTDAVTAFVKRLDAEGFNGVRFDDLRVEECELDDFLDDGKSQHEWQAWLRDYVIFIAQPNLYPEECGPYQSSEVDMDGFHKDFLEALRAACGPAITIRCYEGCCEYECQRVQPTTTPSEGGGE